MALQKISVVIISQILEVLTQIIIVLFFYKSHMLISTNNICLALVLGVTVSEVCSFLYLIKKYYDDYKKYKLPSQNKKNYKKHICQISLPVAFTTYIKSGLSTLKNTLIPVALVTYGLSYNDALSYYGIISSTVMTLILFPFTFIQSYSSLLIPKLSACDIKKDLNKVTRISKNSLSLTCIFSITVAILLIVFSNLIDKYIYKTLSIEFYIKILAPIIIYIYMDNVIDSILKSLNLQVYVMIINIIDLIISILFIKFLIPIFGIYGYILILYFSEIFNFLLSLLILRKKTIGKKLNTLKISTLEKIQV